MKKQLYVVLLSLFLLSAFKPAYDVSCRRSGIRGHVYIETGNRMPSPDQPRVAPQGIKTKLYVYELTNITQVVRQGMSAFYTQVPTKLIKEIETDDDGSFKVKLKPGKYSLFVKKENLFYSSMFDSENNIHPVEVKKGKMTEEVFKVNYNAVY
ncbi:MAG: hypothetical protein ABIR18_15655 [Chitinophagaceae bacterium]